MAPTPRTLRAFWILWIAQAGSLLGSIAVQFALIWWLTAATASATVLATATLVGLAPRIVLGPVIGALVDRWNRKAVMLTADLAVGMASLLLAFLFWRGSAGVPIVLALLAVRGLGDAFHSPAFQASMSLMVPEGMLVRIQGLNQMIQGSGLIVAAPIGALLYGILPMAGVMLADVATALPALLVLVGTAIPRQAGASAGGARGVSLWGEIVEGLRWVADRRGHAVLLGIAVLVNALLVPAFSLLPLLVAEGGGLAGHLAALNSSLGIGMLAGGLFLGVTAGFRRRIHTTLAGMVGVGIATLALGLLPAVPPWPSLLAIFSVGAMASVTNAPVQAILQATVPPELQGRVFTLFTTLATLATPVGLVAAAPVAEVLGTQAWYVAGGVVAAVAAAIGWFVPALLGIEERPAPAAARSTTTPSSASPTSG
jgi:DHA3 family macrolide efflux protein-like MFS transporter